MTVASGHRAARRRDGRGRRLLALLAVAAAVAGGGVLARVAPRPSPATALQPGALAAEAAPVASTSSAWYCPGGPGEAAGTTHILLANAAARSVRADVTVVDERDVRRHVVLRIGAHAEADVVPGALVHGAWLASRVLVAGGAVTATELVDGRAGRAVSACASEVSPRWYFADGSTRAGGTLNVALFDPTPNLAVVDLSFATASGFTAPAPFQGVVVKPWTMRVLTVGAYVQNQGVVATVVSARSGAVVAGELQLYGPGGRDGIALTLGAPAVSRKWDLPSLENQSGGAAILSVFNPTSKSQQVVVGARLPAGPVEPFSEALAPDSVWTLPTSAQPRIATQLPYTVDVRAAGPGVVVAEASAGGPLAPASLRPWAAAVTVSGIETSAPRRWLVGTVPRTRAQKATAAVVTARVSSSLGSPSDLVVQNPSRGRARILVIWWSVSGARHVRRVRVTAFSRATVAVPRTPAVVQADGPVAVMGDEPLAGVVGVDGVPAVPLR